MRWSPLGGLFYAIAFATKSRNPLVPHHPRASVPGYQAWTLGIDCGAASKPVAWLPEANDSAINCARPVRVHQRRSRNSRTHSAPRLTACITASILRVAVASLKEIHAFCSSCRIFQSSGELSRHEPNHRRLTVALRRRLGSGESALRRSPCSEASACRLGQPIGGSSCWPLSEAVNIQLCCFITSPRTYFRVAS